MSTPKFKHQKLTVIKVSKALAKYLRRIMKDIDIEREKELSKFLYENGKKDK